MLWTVCALLQAVSKEEALKRCPDLQIRPMRTTRCRQRLAASAALTRAAAHPCLLCLTTDCSCIPIKFVLSTAPALQCDLLTLCFCKAIVLIWLPTPFRFLQCRYREMGAQVEARLRGFTSRREFVEKTSYDDVSCGRACLAIWVQHGLLELRGLVSCVSVGCVARRCCSPCHCCGGHWRPGM